MRINGILTISGSVSRLDRTRLAKQPLDDDPFGNATIFLRQDRQLGNNDPIWVEGSRQTLGNTDVIVITNAGLRALPQAVAAASARASRTAKKLAAKKRSARKGAKGSTKGKAAKTSAKGKPAAKKTGSKPGKRK
jgi:hypothetical protein